MKDTPLTAEEFAAIQEVEYYQSVTDDTGHTSFVRLPANFLVPRDDGVFTYRDHTGQHWFVGKDTDGKLYKERRNF